LAGSTRYAHATRQYRPFGREAPLCEKLVSMTNRD
jgi:hypothetical protein